MTTATLKTGGRAAVKVAAGTVRDVKPSECGMSDESWFVAQCPDGRWVALSDFADQDVAYFDTEEGAEQYWLDAAEAEASAR